MALKKKKPETKVDIFPLTLKTKPKMDNHKMVFAVGLLALSAVLFSGFFAWSDKQASYPVKTAVIPNRPSGEEASMPHERSLPVPTGNIDVLTQAIETDADNQKALLLSQETEADAITSDSAAISGFSQVYSENDF